MAWKTIERPGYFGKKRDEVLRSYDERYGLGKWRLSWYFNGEILNKEEAVQIYEDAYYEHLKKNSSLLEKLITTAYDVYDTAPSNVQAVYSYTHQETPNTHLHDVSIRRAVLRLGKRFSGKELIQVRSTDSEWWVLSPCMIPFHLPDLILPDFSDEFPEMKDYGN